MPSTALVDVYDTATTVSSLELLLRRRANVIERVALCAHDWVEGPQQVHLPLDDAGQRRARTGGARREYCERCRAERSTKVDYLDEASPAEPPVRELDAAIAAARTELSRMQSLDAAEAVAWSGASWRGEVWFHAPSMPVWLVTIEPFCSYDYFGARVGFDGVVRSYALSELDAAAHSPYLDAAERTVWALIARRVRHAVRETFRLDRVTARR